MKKKNWIETKRECEIGENGELITKKVTLELEKEKGLEKKEIIDISLRLFSLLAIFIPVLLFFQQQKAERDKQKALFQLEVYSNVTTKLHSMINLSIRSKEFETTRNDLFYDIYPKLKLLNEKVVTDSFAPLKDIINFSYGLSTVSNAADSLNKCFVAINDGTSGRSSESTTGSTATKELDQFIWLDKLNNGEAKVRNWNYETAEIRSLCKIYQQRAVGYIKDMQRSADKLVYPEMPKPREVSSEDFKSSEDESRDFNEFTSKKMLFDEFYNNYDSTFRNYLQQHTLILDSMMTRSSSFLYDR
jgi:hypothetical protein